MPLTVTGDIVASAREAGRGAAAFNAITLEHAEAIVAGAEAVGLPVIVALSENAVRFHDGRLRPLADACAALADSASVAVGLHLDHVVSEELLLAVEGTAISSVMFDASKLSYADNVAATRAAAAWAHGRGLWLEAELGQVGGKAGEPALDAHAPGARTRPDEAVDYVAATGVDALAVAVGSSHAMTTRTAALDHNLIAELHAAVAVPLVLHGSSGVPDDELRAATAHGMTKINIGTALNLAYTAALRAELAAHPERTDPRPSLTAARQAMADTVAHLLTVVAKG
ncbi:class II fructose-bisphosphate aldolase [Yinghuangia seranimata]|uniref:class II fructose-bisphosphate aldolase n=1 Tax=Yinghuangia seranimata TaxID=408067 RepID=UPI00248ABE19|nr:class II fructose-bisphosphate aldolase [Yinghuangia seranimata]MDI2131201.1 class II fructose-bisphosphate aldolase [Yinghuangia seranimata]